MSSTRRETDLLGQQDVPSDALWGIHTLRAIENFPISGERPHPLLVRAYALIKKAATIARMATATTRIPRTVKQLLMSPPLSNDAAGMGC